MVQELPANLEKKLLGSGKMFISYDKIVTFHITEELTWMKISILFHLPFNEMGYQNIMKILEHVQIYTPSKKVERERVVPGKTGSEATITIKGK